MPPVPERLRAHALPLLGLLLAVFALNARALHGGFSDPDDFAHLEAAFGIARGDGAAWRAALFPPQGVTAFRPAPWLLWGLDAALFGLRPLGYHATNLALHLLLTALVYAAAFDLGRSRPAAAVAGALVGLSPATGQAVEYLAGRDDLLANAACVGAFLLARRGRAGAAAAIFAVGLLSKVTVAALPAVLLVDALASGRRVRPRDVALFGGVLGVFAVGMAAAWGHTDPSALLSPGQRGSLGHVGPFLGRVSEAALLPLVAKHGGFGRAAFEAPRLLSYVVVLAAVATARGPQRGLALVGAAWLLLNLVVPYPWIAADGFRTQDSGRYLQLPLIGWALLIASACAGARTRWERAAAPAVIAGAVVSFFFGVTPGLGTQKAPVEAFVDALRFAVEDLPPGGRVIVELSRLDHGVPSLAASSLLRQAVPGLSSAPLLALEGQEALWADARPAGSYAYPRFEVVEPTFRVSALDPARDRLLVDASGPDGTVFARVQLPVRPSPGRGAPNWDFGGGDPQGWTWTAARRGPPGGGASGAPGSGPSPAPSRPGVGLELRLDRFLPAGILGRLTEERDGPLPHLLSPPVEVAPSTVCGLELDLTLPDRVPSEGPGGAFLVPGGRFALLAWAGEGGFDRLLDRFLVVPLSGFPGRQTARVRLDNAPSWLASSPVRRIAIVPGSRPGGVQVHGVRLTPCL